MNVRVEAGSICVSLKTALVEPTIAVEIKSVAKHDVCSAWTCLTLTPLSVNGHSISAINPDFTLMGGMTTLAMA